MKKPLRLLVIGGVAAGTKAASKARREDPSMEITIITDEKYISYAGCGLAYYIGGVVEKRDDLFARSPDIFREKQNIKILLEHRAERIDTYDRVVHVTNIASGSTFALPYDKLLIATGASPVIPTIEGVYLRGIFTLNNVTDADSIKAYLADNPVGNVCIVGGGYIGVEMAENLVKTGASVTIFEIEDNVIPKMFDPDISVLIREHMESKGVRIVTGTAVEKFLGDNGEKVRAAVTGGVEYECGMVILAAGVMPNITLAKQANITIGPTGAIQVDNYMQTSTRGIYAAGDCAESTHLVSGNSSWVPLGSTANKQGRVAGANIAGGRKKFPGILGSAIVKVFDLAVGRTGLNEREAKEAGFNPVSVTVTTPVRAGYYPGGGMVTLKLTADRASMKLLGAQAVGDSSVDKVIDTIAAALTGKITVPDLVNLDISYSPPYAAVLGTVIVAAGVLEGKIEGITF
ncbi:FAD-dependent oxidoreductase [Candidatus Latescibacterota bacterium]